jgi:hypothetical protein
VVGEIKIKPRLSSRYVDEDKRHKSGKKKKNKKKYKKGKLYTRPKNKKSKYKPRGIAECSAHYYERRPLKPYQKIAKFLGNVIRVKFSFKPSKEMVDYTVNKLGDAIFYKVTGCNYNHDNYGHFKSNK